MEITSGLGGSGAAQRSASCYNYGAGAQDGCCCCTAGGQQQREGTFAQAKERASQNDSRTHKPSLAARLVGTTDIIWCRHARTPPPPQLPAPSPPPAPPPLVHTLSPRHCAALCPLNPLATAVSSLCGSAAAAGGICTLEWRRRPLLGRSCWAWHCEGPHGPAAPLQQWPAPRAQVGVHGAAPLRALARRGGGAVFQRPCDDHPAVGPLHGPIVA